MSEIDLLARITFHPQIFGGKPIIRGRRLAVEHVLGMLAAGDTTEMLLQAYPWLEVEDVRACLLYARKIVAQERIDLLLDEKAGNLAPMLTLLATPACRDRPVGSAEELAALIEQNRNAFLRRTSYGDYLRWRDETVARTQPNLPL